MTDVFVCWGRGGYNLFILLF